MEKFTINLFLSFLLSMTVFGCAIHPDPITVEEKTALVGEDRALLFQKQEPITGPISLPEAMARAIKYNLNHRLRLMEEAMSQKQLDLSEMGMLPRLAASAGFQDRSNLTSSLGTGALEPSTSSDRSHKDGNLIMSWNILDFGVSYFQAKQDADRVLIAAERRRKVIHNLMRDVRFAFWKAVSTQGMETQINPLLREVELAFENSKTLEKEGLPTPTEAMQYQRALIEIIRQLKTVQAELLRSHMELADLMNLEPGTSYQLDVKDDDAHIIPEIGLSIEEMERMALMNLPELLEENYQERISVIETKKVIARMFPGLEFGGGWNYDSNSYLVNQNWLSISSKLTWNLLSLFSAPQQMRFAEAQETVTKTRRFALSAAALSQVHIANWNYLSTVEQMKLLDKLNQIDQNLLKLALNQQQANLLGQLDRIRGSVQALATRMQRDQTFALLQNAIGLIQVTIGMDPLPQTVEGHDLAALTKAIEGNLNKWKKSTEKKSEKSTQKIMEPIHEETFEKKTEFGKTTQMKIASMLDVANKHFTADRLTKPKGNNALETYRKILELAPEHQEAKQGINRITERLLALGRKDLENWQLIYPKESNAMGKFRTVLSLDANNPTAKAGLEEIVDRFLSLTQRFAFDTNKALNYLHQAELILPKEPRIVKTRAALFPQKIKKSHGTIQIASID